MSSKCSVCGAKIAFHPTTIKDGQICPACRIALPLRVYNDKDNYTAKQIYQILHAHDGEEPKPISSYAEKREYVPISDDKKKAPIAEVQQQQPKEMDKYDEIRECKKLLDEGIITEEEFIAKKKELLGL